MKHISVIQHTQSEWLGQMEDHFEGRGIRFGYFRPFAVGGGLPAASVVGDGLMMIGGGPYGAASQGHRPPWLEAEVRLARACLMLGKPVVGIGFGSQVLSLAAEGSVEAAPLVLEVGEARRTDPEALGGLLPATFPLVVYMRDRPVPPDYANILAMDEQGRAAIFQIGSNSFGFTGNPGVRRAMIEDLVMEFDDCPADVAKGLDRMSGLSTAIDDALVPIMTGVVKAAGWME